MIVKDEFESLNEEIAHKIAEVGYLLGLAKSGQHMDRNELSLEARNSLTKSVAEILDVLAGEKEESQKFVTDYVTRKICRLVDAVVQLGDAEGCILQEMENNEKTELLEEAAARVSRAKDRIVKVMQVHASLFSQKIEAPFRR